MITLWSTCCIAAPIISFSLPDAMKRPGATSKVENGSTIVWRLNSTANEPQIQIYSNSSQKRFAPDVVSRLPGTEKAGIIDVSVGQSGRVAVGVVAVSRDQRIVALLMLFSPEGKLLRALALDPSREIVRLVMDSDDSVWTLCGDGRGELVVHYTAAGEEIGAILSRAQVPEAGDSVDGNLRNGPTSFGLTENRLWLWVTTSWTLVSVNRDGSHLTREPISSLEKPPGCSVNCKPELLRAVQLRDGTDAIQVAWADDDRRSLTGYVRAPGSTNWKLDPRGATWRLLGTDGDRLAYANHDSTGLSLDWR